MFKYHDRGLSNTVCWFFEIMNMTYIENYHNVLTKNNTKHFEQRFFGSQNGEQTYLSEPLLVSETSNTFSTIKFSVRIDSEVFIFFNNRCEIDLSGNNSWEINSTKLL